MKEYLICIDSDGCAIDSMECKHRHCFGPYIIDIWHLEQWKDEILNRWNEINLYSLKRGINRFLGLKMILCEVDASYCRIDGLSHYVKWCEETRTYSNAAIKEQINQGTHSIFERVLDWSNRVNNGVKEIADKIKPFDGVKDALVLIHKNADIAIVSSANPQAVQDEWTRFELMEYVDYVMAQDAGTKKDCIKTLLSMGYQENKVLMVGDALGDKKAAFSNYVKFFPIIVRKESESWNMLMTESSQKFFDGTFNDAYQNELICLFEESLK